MTTSALASAELPPGYYIAPDGTGAWCSLPWPDDAGLDELLAWSIGRHVIEWAEANLIHHLTGEPWRYTVAQRRFIVQWYRVRPDGRWHWRSGVNRRAKGAGKDPFLGTLVNAEAFGPVIPIMEDGRLVGARPHRMALVQIAANSEAQGTDLLRVANGMLSDAFCEEHGVETGIIKTKAASGTLIEILTASERTAEGDPATAIFLNESHHMTESSGGQRLAGVTRRNVGKSPGGMARILEATNAHMPGEESVAEGSYEAWQLQVSGKTRRQDILYDSREAPPGLSLHIEPELEAIIAAAYAEAPWIDVERIRDEAQDPRVPVEDAIRYYANALPTNETAWVEPRRFDALARPDIVVEDGEAIAMFLDCSKSSDATCLSACRISDGHVFSLGGWQRPHGDRGKGWLAPREDVDATVREAFARWSVQWFGVDPSPATDDSTEVQYWAPTIDAWHRNFHRDVALWATPGAQGSSVLFDLRMSARGGSDRNRLFTEAAMQTALDIDEADLDDPSLTHDGDAMLRRHVQHARRRPNQWGISLSKKNRDSKDLVDYAVTMVGARMGRRLVLNSGKAKRPRKPSRVVVLT